VLPQWQTEWRRVACRGLLDCVVPPYLPPYLDQKNYKNLFLFNLERPEGQAFKRVVFMRYKIDAIMTALIILKQKGILF
jgi:hypothetical protein